MHTFVVDLLRDLTRKRVASAVKLHQYVKLVPASQLSHSGTPVQELVLSPGGTVEKLQVSLGESMALMKENDCQQAIPQLMAAYESARNYGGDATSYGAMAQELTMYARAWSML